MKIEVMCLECNKFKKVKKVCIKDKSIVLYLPCCHHHSIPLEVLDRCQ